MHHNKFEIGDNLIVFSNYGKKHYSSKIKSKDRFSYTLENGKTINIRQDTGCYIYSASDDDLQLILRSYRIRKIVYSLYYQKDKQHLIDDDIIDKLERLLSIDDIDTTISVGLVMGSFNSESKFMYDQLQKKEIK